MENQWTFMVLFGAVILGIIFFEKFNNKKIDLSYLDMTLEEIKNRKRDFISIKKLFFNNHKNNKNNKKEPYIDDQTWQDLEMNKIFSNVDMTLTTPGEQRLYEILRYPEMEQEVLEHRNEVISFIQRDKNLRDKLRKILALLGRQNSGEILDLLYEHKRVDMGRKKFYDIMSLIAMASMISILFIGARGFMVLIFISAINMYFHKKLNNEIQGSVKAITYLSKVAAASSELCGIEEKILRNYIDVLRRDSKLSEVILKNSSTIGRVEGLDVIGDYLNSVFLLQAKSYYKIMSNIQDSLEEIRNMYSVIGEIDALISVAIYRDAAEVISTPKFIKGSKAIVAKNAVNPLIIDGVPNDINIGAKGIILTGSNMSGKSTYLRTVGANALMAQTLSTVTAESYEGDFFRIMTSISPKDDIENGKSYYLGEAEAVNRILGKVKEKETVLCIIDEIFRGTNPIERVNAAAEILQYIMEHNAIALIATHDLELADISKNHYEPYYFSEIVSEKDGLDFDYRLKYGVSNTRNAIKLLKYLNYPNSIIEGAEKRIAHNNKDIS